MKFTSESMYRAVRTFIQAFFGVLVGNMALISALDFTMEPKTVITAVCVQVIAPALSAGLAAVMNMKDTTVDNVASEDSGVTETSGEDDEEDIDVDEEEELEDDDEEEIYG